MFTTIKDVYHQLVKIAVVRVVTKWLIITLIVLAGLMSVLLGLGYLLKENEVATTQLKAELEQAAIQQQAKAARKAAIQKNPLAFQKPSLSAAEISQQQIIQAHQYCETNKQCFLLQTHSPALGCFVAVNTTGAAILLKIAGQVSHGEISQTSTQSGNDSCQQAYIDADAYTENIAAQCLDNRCIF